MAVEDDLLARLRKIEALMTGAGTAGERVKARLAEQALRDPPVELQFSMPRRLVSAALCGAVPPLRAEALPLSSPAANDGDAPHAAGVQRHAPMAGVP